MPLDTAGGHRQDPAQVDPGVGAATTCGGFDVRGKAGPQGEEAVGQAGDGLHWQASAVGSPDIEPRHGCVQGSFAISSPPGQ